MVALAEKPIASAGVATTAWPGAGICVGCQYSGAAQCFNGRGSRCLPTWADSTNDTTAVNKTRRNELFRFIGTFAFLGPLSNIISPRILADPILLRPMGTGSSVLLFWLSITQLPPLAHFFSSFFSRLQGFRLTQSIDLALPPVELLKRSSIGPVSRAPTETRRCDHATATPSDTAEDRLPEAL